MQRKKMPIIFYVIIALAVIGLMTNPTHLVRNIFMMLGVGVVIFALFYFIFRKPRPTENDEMKKYKQALKQSKRKYQTTQRQQARPTKSKAKRASHLRVIEGNKDRKSTRLNYSHVSIS